MSRVHTLTELLDGNTTGTVNHFAEPANRVDGNDTVMTDVINSERTVESDEDPISPNRMNAELIRFKGDYQSLDKRNYQMDEESRAWLVEKDEHLLISTSKKTMDRSMASQMRKIDIERMERVKHIRIHIMELRSQIQKCERQIEKAMRRADEKKAVIRRKRNELKVHPI